MIAVSQPTSAAELFANAAAVRKRLFAPQAASSDRIERKEAPALAAPGKTRPRPPMWRPAQVPIQAPVIITPSWKLMDIHFDAHVVDMRVAMGEISLSPVGFLRRRCTALGLDYDQIVGSARNRPIVAARFSLILTLKLEYPNLSLPQIGRIFGGRDHTTILSALRKLGIDHGAIRGATALRAEEIEGLWLAGQTQQEIAIALGLTQSAVSRFIKRQGWKR